MRELKQIYLILLVGVVAVSTAIAEKPNIGMVDMQKLFAQYYRSEMAQQQFNQDYAGIQKKVNQQVEVINEMISQLKSLDEKLKSELLDENLKQKYSQEFQLIDQQRKMLIEEMKRVEYEEKKEVARRKSASMQGIMSEIRAKVVSFAEKHEYDFVFDKSGKNTNQISFFIYLKDATDITASMLKELNKLAPAAASE
jgi:Skp family chaperone for outer membrane proteins